MIASAVFFLLMIFFVCPLCCFKRVDAPDGVKPFDNEGGEAIEMKRNQVGIEDETNMTRMDNTQHTMMQRDVDF